MIKAASDNGVSPKVTLFIVSAVQFLTPFFGSAVSVALPVIGREFQAGAVQLSLVQLIYILAVAALLLPVGRFADIHGRKRIFIGGIFSLTLATVLITFAHTIEFFILFRLIQGIGAAMITSTSVAILSSVFPRKERGRAMGIIIAFVYVGLAAGPTLAGFLVTQFGWRWVFWAILPIELAALILTLVRLKGEWYGARGEEFDWRGTGVYIVSLVLTMTGCSLVGKESFALPLAALGFLGLLMFLYLQSKTRFPLLNTNLLRTNLLFTFNNLATLINYAASFGLIFLFSLHLQEVKGLSAQYAGFVIIIQPLIQACIAPFAGKLADRYPPAYIATAGMCVCTFGLGLAANIDTETSLLPIIAVFAVMGVGFGLFSSPNMVAIMGSVESNFFGVAAGLVSTMRSLGTLVSMTIITVIIGNMFGDQAVSENNRELFVAAMRMSFIVFTCMGCLGILLSLGREWSLGDGKR